MGLIVSGATNKRLAQIVEEHGHDLYVEDAGWRWTCGGCGRTVVYDRGNYYGSAVVNDCTPESPADRYLSEWVKLNRRKLVLR